MANYIQIIVTKIVGPQKVYLYTKTKKKNYNKFVIYMTLQYEIDSDRMNDIS